MAYNFNFNYNVDEMLSNPSKFMSQKKFPEFGIGLEWGLELGYQELAQRMGDKLMENIIAFGLGNGEIFNQINVELMDDGVYMSIDDNSGYAMFVEYGTGIIGEENPHPQASMHGWEYDTNAHGDYGWWYPTVESDPNPTKHLRSTGWFAWTRGQASRPFMYLTWLWASQHGTAIINKHIRKVFRDLESDFK